MSFERDRRRSIEGGGRLGVLGNAGGPSAFRRGGSPRFLIGGCAGTSKCTSAPGGCFVVRGSGCDGAATRAASRTECASGATDGKRNARVGFRIGGSTGMLPVLRSVSEYSWDLAAHRTNNLLRMAGSTKCERRVLSQLVGIWNVFEMASLGTWPVPEDRAQRAWDFDVRLRDSREEHFISDDGFYMRFRNAGTTSGTRSANRRLLAPRVTRKFHMRRRWIG